MKVSFVIVNYNRKDELLFSISKIKFYLQGFPLDYEIIIVDNASSDGSAEAVSRGHPGIILIRNSVNIGAPAWNAGFERASGDYFVILDDDSHLEYGLYDAISYLEANRDVGVLALNVTGGLFTTAHWKDLSDTIGFIGCGAILRRELYQKIGGYADWMFLYNNEWEYGMRCLAAGYKLRYFEKCHVVHRSSNINRSNQRLKIFSVRNEMAVVYKYFSRDHRNLYLFRVYMNNLKAVRRLGFASIPWFITALKEFFQLIRTLPHTPVSKEIENMYREKYWPARRFLGII